MNRPGHIQRAHEKSDQKRIYSKRETTEIRRAVASPTIYGETRYATIAMNGLYNLNTIKANIMLYLHFDAVTS